MIKLLIFDMDGTIIDSDTILIKTWEELYSLYKKNGEVFNHNKISEYSGPPLSYAIKDAFPEMEENFIRQEYRMRTKKYYETDLKLFENTKEVLNTIKEKGIILAILTAKNDEMTHYCLKRFDLDYLFSDFITCDSPFPSKPSPDGINFLKEKYNLKNEEVMMVGDTYYDALASKNANVKSIIFMMNKRHNIDKIEIDKKCYNYLELLNYINEING